MSHRLHPPAKNPAGAPILLCDVATKGVRGMTTVLDVMSLTNINNQQHHNTA